MSYRQSGIAYRESNFVYNRSDATLNVGVINVVCGTPTLFEFPYRKTGTWRTGTLTCTVSLKSNNNTYVVKASPSYVGCDYSVLCCGRQTYRRGCFYC